MRVKTMLGVGLIWIGSVASAFSQDITWRAARPSQDVPIPVSLGKPQPLGGAPLVSGVHQTGYTQPRVARGQIGDQVPQPPVFPGSGAPPVFPTPGASGADIYNRGMPNNDADLGSFWTRTGDKLRRCWDEVIGGAGEAFQSGPNRSPFQSDHRFDVFTSPVSNPYFFEDPRALTEIRPIFMWQRTPSANPVYGGGNNFEYALRGSVAVTRNISIVVNRLGVSTHNPSPGIPGIGSATGMSELMLGPKFSFGSEASNTVAAFGVTFDIPVGAASVQQNTGNTAIIPYFSFAQNFGRSAYGSFNFMNTTGYTFRTDSSRSESFYSSFHLDYEIGKRFYPLAEVNWRYYARSGGARPLTFEGSDLTNYGSTAIAGSNELTLALGGRINLNNFITWGIVAEFNVLSNGTGQHLDRFRLTTDLIFRY
ncbi:MAG: hypothetical protein HYX68_00895 [Planctomycetes bacterium]|nr:hypothetical protein [Planctomycetota bacterium]